MVYFSRGSASVYSHHLWVGCEMGWLARCLGGGWGMGLGGVGRCGGGCDVEV